MQGWIRGSVQADLRCGKAGQPRGHGMAMHSKPLVSLMHRGDGACGCWLTLTELVTLPQCTTGRREVWGLD